MNTFKVKSAPNASRSREILADLSPVKELWRGKTINTLLYVFVGMSLMAFSGLALVELGAPMPIPFIGLLWFPATIFMIGYEQVLVLQKYVEGVHRFIDEYLDDGEKFLALFSGRGLALKIPDWVPDDFFHRSYFIFTTDRILIITFKASKIVNGDIKYYIDKDGLDSIVSGVYCCDYLDENSIRVGGWILNPLANIAHTKVSLQAVGESGQYPWAIENRGTKNGKLLKEILTRLESISSKSF